MRSVSLALLASLLSAAAAAQPFEPGPMGTVPGSSAAGARIDGAPRSQRPASIPNVDIFGDEPAERAYGRDYDDSYLRPKIPRARESRSTEDRATEGRADLNTINAGELARQGPNAIGSSAITRGQGFSRGGRARIATPPAQERR